MSKRKYYKVDGTLDIEIIENQLVNITENINSHLDINSFRKLRSRLYYLKRVCTSNIGLVNRIDSLINQMKNALNPSESDKNGLYIDNVRIIKLDDLNYTYEVYKKVEKKDKTIEYKWVASSSYYSSITHCLTAIKNKVISQCIKTKRMNVDEFIKVLTKLNDSIARVIIRAEVKH